jgi:hypothetical protein
MTTNPFGDTDQNEETTAVGGTWLLDLVASVDHLRRGIRPGFTVWDALEESLRTGEPDWADPDPLRTALAALLDRSSGPIDRELQAAVRRWVLAAADRYNAGHHWPHPAPRRGFPSPRLDLVGEA